LRRAGRAGRVADVRQAANRANLPMKTTSVLPDRVLDVLRPGSPVVLVTVGTDGWGHSALTWAVAVTQNRVRFGVDHGSATLANLERDGKATLQVIGAGNTLSLIKGPAQLLRERIEAAPFGMAMWELSVAEVRDQAWDPVAVSPLAFEWIGSQAEAMRKIEQAVLAELRDWAG
jgi:hypothetical protein